MDMPLPTTGPLSLQMIHSEFGGPTPVSLANYYRGGGLVPNTPANANIPTSGPIALSNFYGAAAVVNDAPVWSTNWDLGYHTANSPIRIQLRANDPEGGTVTYSAGYLPSWLTLSPSGYLQGTAPPESDPSGRTYGFNVDATDNMGAVSTRLFNIRIRPAQATWFSPSMTLEGTDGGGVQNFYYYANDPNGDAQIIPTPGYSLPPNSTLIQEWPESTQPNIKGVTLRGNVIPVGNYTVYLDLVDQYATTTRAFYIRITPAGSGGGGGGGSPGDGGGDVEF